MLAVTVAAPAQGADKRSDRAHAKHGHSHAGKHAGSEDKSCKHAKRGNGIDLAYVEGMIPHHEGAVRMAEMALGRAKTDYVRDLAEAIISSQNAEIRVMRKLSRRMRHAGVEPVSLGLTPAEMGMDHDMSHLMNAADFDRAFVEMMIPHHQGAITMSAVLFDRGCNPQVRRLARQIVAAQKREIEEMEQFLASIGASPGH